MKAYVQKELCIGCELCAGLEAAVFRMDPDGKAEGCSEITEETRENVNQAMEMCPVAAIEER